MQRKHAMLAVPPTSFLGEMPTMTYQLLIRNGIYPTHHNALREIELVGHGTDISEGIHQAPITGIHLGRERGGSMCGAVRGSAP